jgi:hypothetical protein
MHEELREHPGADARGDASTARLNPLKAFLRRSGAAEHPRIVETPANPLNRSRALLPLLPSRKKGT